MLYIALVVLAKVLALSYVVWRLWLARNREAQRADSNARGWSDTRLLLADTRLLLAEVQRERDDNARYLTTAIIRLQEIQITITRRPPRRKWLRLAYRVAGLTDLTTRGVRWPA